jgi:hypothetical protein
MQTAKNINSYHQLKIEKSDIADLYPMSSLNIVKIKLKSKI